MAGSGFGTSLMRAPRGQPLAPLRGARLVGVRANVARRRGGFAEGLVEPGDKKVADKQIAEDREEELKLVLARKARVAAELPKFQKLLAEQEGMIEQAQEAVDQTKRLRKEAESKLKAQFAKGRDGQAEQADLSEVIDLEEVAMQELEKAQQEHGVTMANIEVAQSRLLQLQDVLRKTRSKQQAAVVLSRTTKLEQLKAQTAALKAALVMKQSQLDSARANVRDVAEAVAMEEALADLEEKASLTQRELEQRSLQAREHEQQTQEILEAKREKRRLSESKMNQLREEQSKLQASIAAEQAKLAQDAKQEAELAVEKAEEESRVEVEAEAAQEKQEAEEEVDRRDKKSKKERKRAEKQTRLAAEAEAQADAVAATEKEDKLRVEAEAEAKAEEEERLRVEAEAKAEEEAAAKEKAQKQEEEKRLRVEAESKAKEEAAAKAKKEEERLRIEAETKAKADAEAKAKAEEQKRLRVEAEAKAKEEALALAKAKEEERLRLEAEAKAKQEAAAKAKPKAEEEERLRIEAEAKAKAEEERLRVEAETKAKEEAAAKAKADEEERLRVEAEAKAKEEAAAKAKAEEEERLRVEAEAKAKEEAAAKAKAEEEKRLRIEAEAKRKAEAKAKAEEEERLRIEAETKAKAEAEAKAKADEEERLRLAAEAKAKEEADAKAKAEEEERLRVEAQAKAAEAAEAERLRKEAIEKEAMEIAAAEFREKQKAEEAEKLRIEAKAKAELEAKERARLEAEAAELAEAERAAKDAAERAEALARARALLQEEANIQAAKVQKEMAELEALAAAEAAKEKEEEEAALAELAELEAALKAEEERIAAETQLMEEARILEETAATSLRNEEMMAAAAQAEAEAEALRQAEIAAEAIAQARAEQEARLAGEIAALEKQARQEVEARSRESVSTREQQRREAQTAARLKALENVRALSDQARLKAQSEAEQNRIKAKQYERAGTSPLQRADSRPAAASEATPATRASIQNELEEMRRQEEAQLLRQEQEAAERITEQIRKEEELAAAQAELVRLQAIQTQQREEQRRQQEEEQARLQEEHRAQEERYRAAEEARLQEELAEEARQQQELARAQEERAAAAAAGEQLSEEEMLYRELEEARNREFEDIYLTDEEKAENRAAEAAREAILEFREKRMTQHAAAAKQQAQARRGATLAVHHSNEVDNVLYWMGDMQAGSRATLVYNRNSESNMQHCQEVTLILAYDGWSHGNQEVKMFPLARDDPIRKQSWALEHGPGEWFVCQVDLSETAVMVDYVFCGGGKVYDNNKGKDYHTEIQGGANLDQLEEALFHKLVETNAEKDAAMEEQIVKAARARALGQSSGAGVISASAVNKHQARMARLEHFVYCEPRAPTAGQAVQVFYNPQHSLLKGQEVTMNAGFNRFLHSTQASVPMAPQQNGWLAGTVQVPADAHVLDVVFHGRNGQVDDNNKKDFHWDVAGAVGQMRMLHVLNTAVELAPVCKVGGMGDVVTALSRSLSEEGHRVDVVVPKYDILEYDMIQNLVQVDNFHFDNTNVKVWKGDVEGISITFLDPENGMFNHGCIYGRNDDHIRFGFFSRATAQLVRIMAERGERPDVVHAHDWQTAPCTWEDLAGAKTAFTIHNLEYGADLIGGAMAACTFGTTVSPTYAEEVAHHGSVKNHQHKFIGILNGIDSHIWNPADDEHLPMNYDVNTTVQGKAASKAELQKRLNLHQRDAPVVGVVSRLVNQKGLHLVKRTMWRTLEKGGQFVLLGSAPDGNVQNDFNNLANHAEQQYPGNVKLVFSYDEPLSHLIYAGCDIISVPSMFEPCGLTQMIAMRYGAVPLVRRTGGLRDSVFDVDDDQQRALEASVDPNGFSFDGTDDAALDYALDRALHYWYDDRGFWNSLAERTMSQDWSWNYPSMQYIDAYYKAIRQ